MNRREFGMAMAVIGLGANARSEEKPEVEKLQLSRNGWMPNNERLPVLLYRRAFSGDDVVDRMENTFRQNLWPPHGSARLTLGGEGGHGRKFSGIVDFHEAAACGGRRGKVAHYQV